MRRLIPLFLLLCPLLSFATVIPIAERPISPITIPPGPTPAADDPVVVYADYGLRAGLWRTFAVVGATQPVAPRKLWSGDVQYLVTCRTNSGTLAAWQSGTQLMTAAVDDRGELLAPPRVLDVAGATPQGLGWDGRRALLVSARGTPFVRIYGTVLDASGAAIAPTLTIQSNETLIATPFVTTTAIVPVDHTFVIFFGDILVSRMTDDDVLLDPTPVRVVTPTLSINFFGAAYDGKQIALVLHDGAGSLFAVRRVFVDPGTLATRELPSIATAHLWSVGVVWDGFQFVAYWTADSGDGVDLTTLRFTADEAETPAVLGRFGPEAHASAIVTAHDIRFLGASFPPASMQLLFTDRSLVRKGPFPVIVAPVAQRFTALAPGLVVWGEGSFWNSDSTVLWARSDNGIAVPISDAADVLASPPPRAVFTGSIRFVVWSEIDPTTHVYSIKYRRLGLDGRPLDAAPQTIATRLPSAAIAWSGTAIVLVASTSSGLTAFRFDANGNALDPVNVSITAPAERPDIASNGHGFFVVWNSGSSLIMDPAGNGYDVLGARLLATGLVVDTTPIPITTRKIDEYAPQVASNGNDYLVTWTVGRTLIAQRVSEFATVDGAQQTIADDVTTPPIALAGNAAGYWAAWNNGLTGHEQLEIARLDLFGAPLERGLLGAMTDTIPSILAGTNGATVAYGRFVAGVEAPRVFTTSVMSQAIRPHAARR